jgi:PTS system nitrogen regulatory IIA component
MLQSEVTTPVVTPATLADYTRRGLVVAELREPDTAGVIGELSQALQREGCLTDVLPFYQAALNQELLNNSALGCGIALPHARLPGVRKLQFALGRARQPLVWGAGGCGRVGLVFLLAVPATDAAQCLQVLASLARLGSQPDLVRGLQHARDVDGMIEVLRAVALRHG